MSTIIGLPEVSESQNAFGHSENVKVFIPMTNGSDGLHVRITCRTQTGHPSSPWLFDNAIEKSFEIWNLIKNFRLPEENLTSRFYSVSSCITKIDAFSPVGVIPPECTIHLDLRIPPKVSAQEVLDEYEYDDKLLA